MRLEAEDLEDLRPSAVLTGDALAALAVLLIDAAEAEAEAETQAMESIKEELAKA